MTKKQQELKSMYDQGYITKEGLELALKELEQRK